METEKLGMDELKLVEGLEEYLSRPEIAAVISKEHTAETPLRFLRVWEELFAGVYQDPAHVLRKSFSETEYDQMVVVRDIDFVSVCAHHLLPFIGRASFGYIPDRRIVGLSKIARVVEILSHRPQVQEQLTQQIVHVFMDVVEPKGCACVITANHLCMSIRGIRKPDSITTTTALAGVLLNDPAAKLEFLGSIK